MPASDDLILITAYLAGDVRAFDILFQRYHAPVRAVCLRYVGDEAVAEDLVQETFFRVIRALAASIGPSTSVPGCTASLSTSARTSCAAAIAAPSTSTSAVGTLRRRC